MKWLYLSALTLLLSGCGGLMSSVEEFIKSGPDSEGTKPAELVVFVPEMQPVQLWSTKAVGKYQPVGSGLRPALYDGIIFVADSEGVVAAVDSSNGEYIWKVEVNAVLGGGVGVGGDLVVVGSTEGGVHALDIKTGEERWSTSVSSEVLAAPGVSYDVVIVQTQDGRAVALNASDGEKRWQFELDTPVLTLRGTSPPVIRGNAVILSFANGKVYAVATDTGAKIWDNRVAIPQGRTELERMVDIDGQPLVTHDVIYAVSYQGRIGAMSRSSGRAIWYQESSSTHGPAYGLGQVYVVETDDKIKALRSSSGQTLWTNDQLTYRKLNGPTVAGGYLVSADKKGYLHVISQTDGRFVGRVLVDDMGVSIPMVSDGQVLYVLGNSGKLKAYKFE